MRGKGAMGVLWVSLNRRGEASGVSCCTADLAVFTAVEKGKTEGKMVMAAANSGGLGTDGMAACAGLGTECQERHGRAPDR